MNTLKLNPTLKNEAIKIFKNYGLSLDEGINLLLDKFIYQKINLLDIELVLPDEPDYKLIQVAKKQNEPTYTLEEVAKELDFWKYSSEKQH